MFSRLPFLSMLTCLGITMCTSGLAYFSANDVSVENESIRREKLLKIAEILRSSAKELRKLREMADKEKINANDAVVLTNLGLEHLNAIKDLGAVTRDLLDGYDASILRVKRLLVFSGGSLVALIVLLIIFRHRIMPDGAVGLRQRRLELEQWKRDETAAYQRRREELDREVQARVDEKLLAREVEVDIGKQLLAAREKVLEKAEKEFRQRMIEVEVSRQQLAATEQQVAKDRDWSMDLLARTEDNKKKLSEMCNRIDAGVSFLQEELKKFPENNPDITSVSQSLAQMLDVVSQCRA